MTHYISDLIIRIKNGQKARLESINIPQYYSNICINILNILEKEGFIRGYKIKNNQEFKNITIFLKYNVHGLPTINNIFVVSTPSKRIYTTTIALWKIKSANGGYILSTPYGLLFDRDAKRLNVGGEILLGIY